MGDGEFGGGFFLFVWGWEDRREQAKVSVLQLQNKSHA